MDEKIEFDDYYDEARYRLVYRLSLALIFSLPVLVILYFFNKNTPPYPALIAFVFAGVSVILLKRRKVHKQLAIIWSLIAICLNFLSVLLFNDVYHFADAFWMVGAVLFSFFTLGKKWGLTVLSINIVALVLFVIIQLDSNVANLKVQTNSDIVGLVFNTVIGGFITGFLINEFLKVNEFAKDKLLKANREVQNQVEIITSQDEEKSVMLKEIHHRVKNNLQVITSLLRLQSREFKDTVAKDRFTESIHRVSAMALIHERMYQSDDLANIDVSEYVNSLITDLINSYAVEVPIKLNVQSTIDNIGSKTIVSFALILNELASNSLKHAFKNVKEGVIDVSIDSKEGFIHLVFKDNGTWITPTVEGSFGLELVDILVEQLEGSFEKNIDDGTTYTFKLSNMFN
jgi:two-component sensor histidine kinase